MTAEIIDFTTRHRTPARKRTKLRGDMSPSELEEDESLLEAVAAWTPDRPTPAGTTTTAKNARLRRVRWRIWRRVDAVTNYWRVLLEFQHAVSIAKRHGLKEARAYSDLTDETRWSILESYRDALGKQLLTPAPDAASVNWKRQQLKKRYIGQTKERVQQAIADDVAFLDAHPMRNSRASKLQ